MSPTDDVMYDSFFSDYLFDRGYHVSSSAPILHPMTSSTSSRDLFNIECPILTLNLTNQAAALVDCYFGNLNNSSRVELEKNLKKNSIFDLDQNLDLNSILKNLLFIQPYSKKPIIQSG